MSESSVQILNAVFAIGSIPPTIFLLLGFVRDMKKSPNYIRATLSALIFLVGAFLIAAVGNSVISFFFLSGNYEQAEHYEQLRVLFMDATWFTVSWALYLVRTKAK